VQSKLIDSRIAARRREKKTQNEIVVKVSNTGEEIEDELELEILSDGERRRRIASVLVMIGSMMGILSGILILQGNPAELLNSSLFSETENLDVYGQVLDVDGYGVENVTVTLINLESGKEIDGKKNLTEQNGRFTLDNVPVKDYKLKLTKQGYESVEVIFRPERVGISPITMHVGDINDVREEDDRSQTDGWSLENAVALSTFQGLFTIACALVGIHASFEIRRKKKYRRTQVFCWVALFSRGLIIFGPALILIGMIFLMLDKEDFEDQIDPEVF